ncbi:MAG: hypothetical protein WC942_10780, partial [Clostridia bacterium]
MLILSNTYTYFESSLSFIYQDLSITEEDSLTATVKQNGSTIATLSFLVNESGMGTGSFDITRDDYSVGNYSIEVGEDSKDFVVDYRAYLIQNGLTPLLQSFMNISVNDETGINFTEDGKDVSRFSFGNWVYNYSKFLFRKNNEDISPFGDLLIDFENGKLYLKYDNFHITDDISSSYKFRLIDETTLASCLEFALNAVNAQPPLTSYSFETAPRIFDAPLILRAYICAIQKLLLDIEFWDNRLIFPEPTGLRSTLN